jgi:hypothetical protein
MNWIRQLTSYRMSSRSNHPFWRMSESRWFRIYLLWFEKFVVKCGLAAFGWQITKRGERLERVPAIYPWAGFIVLGVVFVSLRISACLDYPSGAGWIVTGLNAVMISALGWQGIASQWGQFSYHNLLHMYSPASVIRWRWRIRLVVGGRSCC